MCVHVFALGGQRMWGTQLFKFTTGTENNPRSAWPPHTKHMEKPLWIDGPSGQNSLASNYISQHDRNRSKVELFHFWFDQSVEMPSGTTTLSSVFFSSYTHTAPLHTHHPTHTGWKRKKAMFFFLFTFWTI